LVLFSAPFSGLPKDFIFIEPSTRLADLSDGRGAAFDLSKQFSRNPIIQQIFRQFANLALEIAILIFVEQFHGFFIRDRFSLKFSVGFKPNMRGIAEQKPFTAKMLCQGPCYAMGKFGRGEISRDKSDSPAIENIAT